jgi:hypothetical protein
LRDLRIDRQNFPIQDGVSDAELIPELLGQPVEAPERQPAFGCERCAGRGDVEKTSEPVVLGLEEPVRVVERLPLELGEDGWIAGMVRVTRGLTGAPGQPYGAAGGPPHEEDYIAKAGTILQRG